ncbi:hypothetical protein [Kineothrix sp. MB12-C1]|uniref:hypothetical protein n=1 Tax=Kineothrix sp. MB12-C1 TaxID=3070215 RepID=UPI0027D25BBE|nr:hypothetical protein [Kineothrix sp. MB12-C1]WMC92396.1 hypothetical protein RBB56_16370 [Kineothrix sp. MB12-C1]
MKERNYWQQFISTGRIEDYLSFKNAQENTSAFRQSGRERTGSEPDKSRVMGDNPYAGIRETNRNGFEDGAYRGI